MKAAQDAPSFSGFKEMNRNLQTCYRSIQAQLNIFALISTAIQSKMKDTVKIREIES